MRSLQTIQGFLLRLRIKSQTLYLSYDSGPQAFWHQGPVSWKTVFPRTGEGDGFGMIQAHCIYCALYFYYYYIVIYNEIIMQLTVMQNQWEP